MQRPASQEIPGKEQAGRSDALRASPPMFESKVLDGLTRAHPVLPAVVYGPAITVLLVLALGRLPILEALAWIVGGYAFWTLCEYWIHRAVFHFEPERGIGARIHWMIHGVHHDHPNDPMRLVMPPSASLPLALAFFGLFLLVLGTPSAFGVMAGFLAGYVAYDVVHYRLHHHPPRSRLGRRLRELHMRHHFQDDTRGFGISAPYWDRAFGTAPKRVPPGGP